MNTFTFVPHLFTTPVSLKLTEDNFLIWKQQILATIQGLEFLHFLEGDNIPSQFSIDPDTATATLNPHFLHHQRQDHLLVAWLLASMSPTMLNQMVGLTTAAQIWKKLNTYYASHSRARVKKLKLQLKTPKRERDVPAYLLDIKKSVNALSANGSSITDEDHIEVILDGLPEEYDPFITSVLSRIDPYTVDEIEVLLLAQEERLEKHKQLNPALQTNVTSSQINVTSSSWNNPSQRGGSNNRGGRFQSRSSSQTRGGRSFQNNQTRSSNSRNVQCQICLKMGHGAPDCWYRLTPDYQPQPQVHNAQASPPVCESLDQLSSASTVADSLWYPDSGASHHVTSDPSIFSSQNSYTSNARILLGNGSGLPISHTGSAIMSSDNHHARFILKNLLHVLNITKNLISVSQFARNNNMFFEFYPDFCNVKHQDSKVILLQGRLKDGIYVFPHLQSTT